MCIIRNKSKKTNFTQIDNNNLRTPNLSFQAKGLLGYLLSFPDNWTFYLAKIVKEGPDGQFAVNSSLKELERAGYVKRKRTQDEKGRIKWEKVVYETPSLNPDWQSKLTNPEWQPKVKVCTPKPVEAEIKKEQPPESPKVEIHTNESKVVLKFTKDFSEAEKDAMTSMLQGINKAQQIVDVLEKMMSRTTINNPVGYLRGIIKKYEAKQFTPVSSNTPKPVSNTQISDESAERLALEKRFNEEKEKAIDALFNDERFKANNLASEQAAFLKQHIEGSSVLVNLYRKNGFGTPAIQKPFRHYITNIYLPEFRDLETWSAGIEKKRPNVEKQIKIIHKEQIVHKDEQAKIDDCPFCNASGYLSFELPNGYTQSPAGGCPHNEKWILRYAKLKDALIVTALPGYKGHKEGPVLKENNPKSAVELQQEFVQALQKFGQNNCFGGDTLYD